MNRNDETYSGLPKGGQASAQPVTAHNVPPRDVIADDVPVQQPPGSPAGNSADTDQLTGAAIDAGISARGGDVPNTVEDARRGAAPAWETLDVRARDFAQIGAGWGVFSSDGEHVGDVQERGPDWLAVPYGAQQERTMYMPETYVESVANRRVVLNQPYGLLIDMKLDAPPTRFPEANQRLSGTEHEPRRGEFGDNVAVGETPGIPAQVPPMSPPATPLSGSAATGQAGTLPVIAAAAQQAIRVNTGAAMAGQPGIGYARRSGPAAEPPPHVEPTLPGGPVMEAPGMGTAPHTHDRVSTHMDASVTDTPEEVSTAWQRVNAQDTLGQTFEERSGFTVLSEDPHYDHPDGPTHQPGVMNPLTRDPLRTQFGDVGTPGDGKERNITDLDLLANRHPEGNPFDSQQSTVGRPLAPGEPSAAERSLQRTAGLPVPPDARPHDVPPGAVSRPLPETRSGPDVG